MTKAAVILLAGTETHAQLGRLVNGLEAAREFARAPGDDLELIFDGAGTQWVPKLEDPDHDSHDLYRSLRDHATVCEYCTGAFGVEDGVSNASVSVAGENEGHPSVRDLVADGYEVITY